MSEVRSKGTPIWAAGDIIMYTAPTEDDKAREESGKWCRGTVLRYLRDNHVLVERTHREGKDGWKYDPCIDAVHPWTLQKELV